jgi:hypothetical protein
MYIYEESVIPILLQNIDYIVCTTLINVMYVDEEYVPYTAQSHDQTNYQLDCFHF